MLRDGSDQTADKHGENFITASPLDYHLFRQEITSKYPSYSPPPPLVPIELENNSILPPLPNHPSRRSSQEQLHMMVGPTVNGGGSIFNQPVHIATPAPSPPPSPAGPGGKGGKKQNYQTNQNFPFLYPPLDDASNTVGGKGKAELKDQLVGKRWEGSDVPASILEAGQLFASRMRMSRSIRQLWDVREKFIKYERGWNGKDEENEEMQSTKLTATDDEKSNVPNEILHANNGAKREKETENVSVQRRLDAVEQYYVCSTNLEELVHTYSCSVTRCLISNPLSLFYGKSRLLMYPLSCRKQMVLMASKMDFLSRKTMSIVKASGGPILIRQFRPMGRIARFPRLMMPTSSQWMNSTPYARGRLHPRLFLVFSLCC